MNRKGYEDLQGYFDLTNGGRGCKEHLPKGNVLEYIKRKIRAY